MLCPSVQLSTDNICYVVFALSVGPFSSSILIHHIDPRRRSFWDHKENAIDPELWAPGASKMRGYNLSVCKHNQIRYFRRRPVTWIHNVTHMFERCRILLNYVSKVTFLDSCNCITNDRPLILLILLYSALFSIMIFASILNFEQKDITLKKIHTWIHRYDALLKWAFNFCLLRRSYGIEVGSLRAQQFSHTINGFTTIIIPLLSSPSPLEMAVNDK